MTNAGIAGVNLQKRLQVHNIQLITPCFSFLSLKFCIFLSFMVTFLECVNREFPVRLTTELLSLRLLCCFDELSWCCIGKGFVGANHGAFKYSVVKPSHLGSKLVCCPSAAKKKKKKQLFIHALAVPYKTFYCST